MDASTNPLLLAMDDDVLALPAFGRIRPADFPPAFERAMALHRDELAAIACQSAPADFDNSIAAFDRAGLLLQRTEAVFHNLTASATSPELQQVQRQMAGPLAAHWSAVYQDAALFARIAAVHQARGDSGLSAEQQRLVERLHRDFQRAGAQLAEPARSEFAALAQQHAELTTRFAQNVLHDEAAWTLALPDAASMAGLPEFVRAAARQAAAERGLDQPVITLSRSLIVPFLSFSERRDLREAAWRAWVSRGEHDGEHDNRPVARELLALRRRQAQLMGADNYADFKLADTMAGTRQRVWALLDEVWTRALPALDRERQLLRQAMDAAGATHPLQAWDWRFWAERVRQQHYALDEAALKPYFALPNMVAAAFECAGRLFGLAFERRGDLQAYHPDVDVYEVRDARAGTVIGLFLHDNFSRPTKRSGAWMSTLALQHRNAAGGGAMRPIVLNNNNFAKAEAGQPTLLSPDDVRTLFHEFGHGLHGLLSDVGYLRLSGTRVLRDFVELPSQLFEHWGVEREVLRRHARHWQTGEALPEALIERLEAARRFGQGYETVRYTASAIADLAAHESPQPVDDIVAFEARVMAERGLPADAGMNHRLPHFQHLFSGDSYAAGYYVYLWAEVLEADAFDAFVEAGDAFDATVAQRLKDCILSRGDSVEPGAAFRAFRGRDAVIEPMLRGRGLV
ncbi:MAG: M3 family metallopeptidase [Burkholderiaceae bacterium]|nr:M3 family metallopeptidase [Burkholderiaceae bacterium]